MDEDLAGHLRDADLDALGRRIRNARLARGLTQAELADGQVTVGYVSRIEAGQRRPDLQLLKGFAALLQQSVEQLVSGSDEVLANLELEVRFAELSLESGDADQAAASTAELLDHPALSAGLLSEVRYLRGRALEATGDYNGAIDELEVVSTDQHSRYWLRSLIALSRCYREACDFARAIEVGDRVRARLAELDLEGSDEAIQLELTVSFAHYARGDVGHAIRLTRQTIARAEAVGSATAQGSAYWNASIYEARRGSPLAAIPLAQQALALMTEGSDSRNIARLRAQLGYLLIRLDPPETDEAEQHLQLASRALRASSASVIDQARCDLDIARVRLAQGDLVEAAAVAESVFDRAHEVSPGLEAAALTVLGQLASRKGEIESASERYRSAVLVLTSVGSDRDAAQSWLDLGALLEEVGDMDAARQAYRSAAVATGLSVPRTLSVRS
jgi:tetratricopeptide (TPR) repeat protein